MASQKDGGISWTDETWNPVTGCVPVSEGCKNCYAARYARRNIGDFAPVKASCFEPGTGFTYLHFSEVRIHPERLEQPLHWKKPRMVFVCSMGDLFHEDVPDEFIDKVFAVMSLCPQHTFQVLTKRPERMRLYLGNARLFCNLVAASNRTATGEECTAFNPNMTTLARVSRRFPNRLRVPLPNVWLGVTAENQAAADERIPLLLQTPAALRFVSCEPLLGPVTLRNYLPRDCSDLCPEGNDCSECGPMFRKNFTREGLDWMIVGGETGPGARPMQIEWVESLIDQCRSASVPIHIKQIPVNGKISKNMDEWPEHLRIREFPS